MSTSFWNSSAFLVFCGLLGLICDAQHLHVKHAPSYIVFQSQDSPVSSSDLHNVLAGPFGLNNKQGSIIQSKSVLKRPKANVLFTVVTHRDQNLPVDSLASYRINLDDPFVNVEHMMDSVQSTYLDKDPVLLDVISSNKFFDVKSSSSVFQSLPSTFDSIRDRLLDPDSFLSRLLPSGGSSLNSSRSSDSGLLVELQMVDNAISALKRNPESLKTKIPDLLSFTLTGLPGVTEEHGVNSQQARDAQDIITKHLNQITEDLKLLYNGNVMVEVLTVPHLDQAKARKTRSLMAEAPVTSSYQSRLNLEIDWYADCPAIFNIVLWLMVVLTITVFFVAYGIWNVNPNLESILYRVPQDDLKKTN